METPGFTQNGNVQRSRPWITSVSRGLSSNSGFETFRSGPESIAPVLQRTCCVSFETENLAVLARQFIHGLRLALIHL